MIYRVHHRTTYHYGEPVPVSLNQCCLHPRNFSRQRCIAHRLAISPEPSALDERDDLFGNHHVIFNLSQPHREMNVEALSEVEVLPRTFSELERSAPWETSRDILTRPTPPPSTLEAMPFVFESPMISPGAKFAEYAAPSFPQTRPLLSALLDFTQRIKKEFIYDPRATTLATRSEAVLVNRRGVCQDFAQLEVACLRSIGLAARYVSGYLLTHPLPGKPRLVGTDASHCWVSVFDPGLGWIDVDPTNGCFVSEEHITIAWGRDYSDVTPVRGVILGGGRQSIEVAVGVEPSITDWHKQG